MRHYVERFIGAGKSDGKSFAVSGSAPGFVVGGFGFRARFCCRRFRVPRPLLVTAVGVPRPVCYEIRVPRFQPAFVVKSGFFVFSRFFAVRILPFER